MKIHVGAHHLARACALARAMGHEDVEGDSEAPCGFVIIETTVEQQHDAARLGPVLEAALDLEVRITTGDPRHDYNWLRLRTFSGLPGARTQVAVDAVVREDISLFDDLNICPSTRDMLLREVFGRVPQARIDELRRLWKEIK
jgi:hypothetical protein